MLFDARLRYEVLLTVSGKRKIKTEELKQRFDLDKFMRQGGGYLVKTDPENQFVEITYDGLLFLEEYEREMRKYNERRHLVNLLRMTAACSALSACMCTAILLENLLRRN